MGGILVDILVAYYREIFEYIEETGDLVWRHREDRSSQWNGRYAGKVAGSKMYCTTGGPYIVVNVANNPTLAHRIIWIYLYGYVPDKLDHWDGNGLNNRRNNIREATQSENQANNHLMRRGVEQRGNSFRARIKVDGAIIQLGSYRTYEQAQAVYNEAADKYYGEYARCNRVA